MKYAEKLESLKVKAWKDKYVDYKFLKKVLKRQWSYEIERIYNQIDKNDETVKEKCVLEERDQSLENVGEKKEKSDSVSKQIDYHYLFFYMLKNYIKIIKDHYEQEFSYLNRRLSEIISYLDKEVVRSKDMEILKKNCLNIYKLFEILNNYLNINILSVYKILKKKNKKQQSSKAMNLYEYYYKELAEISKEKNFNEKIKSTYISIQKKGGKNFEQLDLINFKIYVKNQIGNIGKYKGMISFLSGIFITLIINVIILLYLNVNNLNINIIMSVLPIYRLIYIINFFYLFIFGALFIMQSYGVNFMYILDLNTIVLEDYNYLMNYIVCHLFVTTISLLIYLIDVLFQMNIFSYMIFHVIILLFILCGISLIPIRFRKPRKESLILHSFVRVLLSGLFWVDNVNLLDNVVGDVLTSLSKTFSDIQYCICFILNKMNTDGPARCPVLEKYVNPFFIGLPFYLRLCQCVIRYRKEKNPIHVYNMLKYLCGIIIVVCTSFNWSYYGFTVHTSKLILICVYVISSTFVYIWDIYFDWGLLKEYDHMLRKNNNMMYPPYYYYLGSFFNLLFRLTWAVTIMPISIFENQEINSFLITFLLMFIEIFRRSMWICFRLENEHITNASKYRAILWVPKMPKTKVF